MFNLDFLLINSEIGLILKWTEDYVLTEKAAREFRTAEDGPPLLDEVAALSGPKDLNLVSQTVNCMFQ